jgi:hypothetical protein
VLRASTLTAVLLAASALIAAQPQAARADNLWLHSCAYYGNDDISQGVWSTQQAYSPDYKFSQSDNCGSGGAFGIHTLSAAWGTHWEQWSTVSPAGISIDSAWTPPCSGGCSTAQQGVLINCTLGADGYVAHFVWGPNQGQQGIGNNDGGNCPYTNHTADGTPINRSFGGTHFFGFQLSCNKPSNQTCPAIDPGLGVRGIQLGATETAVPSISASAPDNLAQSGWIRGSGWKIGFQASDPSGVCNVRALLNGQLIQGPTAVPNQAYWDQCDPSHGAQGWTDPTAVDTTQYPDGTALQLTYQAQNAAGIWSPDATTTSHVDNSPVTLTLAGPKTAAVSAGTQYVTASSSANPSGDTIRCQTDGGPWTTRGSASARIPISGLGKHRVSCYSQDGAVDTNGNPERSATQTWSVKVGQAVRAGITFARVSRTCRRTAHALRCHTASPQLRVERIAHGRRTTVRGWFATADGAALSHVRIKIRTAPDDGTFHWRGVKNVSTAADGSWRATLPSGPSRLIQAVYRGGSVTERATSPTATVLVPASSTLHFARVVSFGHSVRFWGHVLGGFVPPTGTIVVVQAFDRGHWRNIATVRSSRNGGWSARYAISGGAGSYPVRVRIPRQADYPWAPAVTAAQALVVRP